VRVGEVDTSLTSGLDDETRRSSQEGVACKCLNKVKNWSEELALTFNLYRYTVATLYEVAKQAKYLLAPELRASVEEYVSLLGRLQLNGFEMTAATASGGRVACSFE
jgi:hypothetical protein